MSRKIYPVILSGGSGTRLWPLSRDLFPKQLLSLVGPESLLAATAKRVSGDSFAGPVIVCNAAHRHLVKDQLAAVGIAPEAIIIEPVARNTAPAIAAAAALLRERDPDALMLVLPSDHIIRDLPALTGAIGAAAKAADTGCLVTFGITPTAPETGYGYIRSGAPLGGIDGAFKIARFVEKPDLATAETYLAEGDWSWNSGMFVFPAALMLEELSRFEPELVAGSIKSVEDAVQTGDVVALDAVAFADVPSKSIDYALMERTEISAIVPASLGWSDVGSWSALWEIGDKDTTDNVMIGDVMIEETGGSYLRSHGPLIATLGVSDLVIVATGDVVMVAAKDRSQDVKRFVNRLRDGGRTEGISHRVINQPWGTWQTIDSGAGFTVRRISVKPGATIPSSEGASHALHLTVAGGTALVTIGGDALTLIQSKSLDIPVGSSYQLENAGAGLLELIETQFGPNLGGATD
jgi:mannose-1-phosphate guanylyltransferase/mannose-1-phosphate guanylyltransferase/mannose-6-phosphate isomerase